MTSALQTATTALESILFGLTNADNKVWPTVHKWTKKERDEAMLEIVRNALAKIRQS